MRLAGVLDASAEGCITFYVDAMNTVIPFSQLFWVVVV